MIVDAFLTRRWNWWSTQITKYSEKHWIVWT